MKNQSKTIIAGLLMLTMFTSSIAYSNAFAQETDVEILPEHRPAVTFMAGAGAAVSQEDDHGYRSHFKLGMVQVQDDDEVQLEVKRGKFVAAHKAYHIVPDTWKVEVSSDGEEFEASGIVENDEGNFIDIEIKGEKIRDLQRGALYYVTGEATDGETEWDLYYISAMFERTPRITPQPLDSSLE
jgi:hypothetical protein